MARRRRGSQKFFDSRVVILLALALVLFAFFTSVSSGGKLGGLEFGGLPTYVVVVLVAVLAFFLAYVAFGRRW